MGNILNRFRTDRVKKMLSTLADKHYIKELYLFGSATNGNFDDKRSDLDFFIVYDSEKINPAMEDYFDRYFDNYMDTIRDLKHLFKKEVDIVTPNNLKNIYFIEEIQKTRVRLL